MTPLSVDDAAEMVAVLASPELYEFTGGEAPSFDSLRERYRHQVAGSGDPAEEWRNWIVRSVESGQAIGFIQADITAEGAELAWVIGVAEQGRGFASEAAAAVQEQLRSEGFARFRAFIHPEHVASQAVARNLGLVRTGVVDDDGEEEWASDEGIVSVTSPRTANATLSVRRRIDADVIELVEVAAAVQALDGYPAFLPDGDYERFLTEPASLAAWVAVVDGRVVGHVALNEETSPPVMDLAAALGVDPLYVARLLVDPSARRLGGGRALLDTAAAEARARGRTPMLDVLDIEKAAPAMSLYRSAGWRDVGRVTFEVGSESLTELVFEGPR